MSVQGLTIIHRTHLWSSPADVGEEGPLRINIPPLSETKVDQDRNIAVAEQDVGWFDVVVCDTSLV